MALLGRLDAAEEGFSFLRAGIPDEEAEIRPAAGVVHGNNAARIVVKPGISDPAVFRPAL